MELSYPSFEVKKSLIAGKGLFAARLIKNKEVVVSWYPKVLTRSEADKLPKDERRHYLYPDGGKLLWMQPPERYVNHSCEPNTRVVNKSDVAIRDIQVGEEITSDYMDLEPQGFQCNCGAKNCRGSTKKS